MQITTQRLKIIKRALSIYRQVIADSDFSEFSKEIDIKDYEEIKPLIEDISARIESSTNLD